MELLELLDDRGRGVQTNIRLRRSSPLCQNGLCQGFKRSARRSLRRVLSPAETEDRGGARMRGRNTRPAGVATVFRGLPADLETPSPNTPKHQPRGPDKDGRHNEAATSNRTCTSNKTRQILTVDK